MASCATAEEFFAIYRHLKRPSVLPLVSDYHLFRKDVRPIWEDEENKSGGKWIVRLKKGVSDRYWEDLLFAIIGDQFGEAGEEICGAVLSVRNGEDILSVWMRADGGRVLRIRYVHATLLVLIVECRDGCADFHRIHRETMKRLLGFPPDTKVEWKSHDTSIQQRTAIDEARRDKASSHHAEKRSSKTQQAAEDSRKVTP
jgi:translation initiation factor 4E